MHPAASISNAMSGRSSSVDWFVSPRLSLRVLTALPKAGPRWRRGFTFAKRLAAILVQHPAQGTVRGAFGVTLHEKVPRPA